MGIAPTGFATDVLITHITHNPGAWQASEHGRDLRRFVKDRFPFTIVYTELADEILVIAIAHASREPGYWRTRL